MLEISSVPKTTIIWGTVPEIWSETQNFFVILGHFLLLYVITLHMYTKNHNMMYSSWDMEYKRPNFLSFWAIFCPFTPLLTPKLKILDLKKSWRYPITHVYHKWRWYDVWFLRCKARQTEFFLSFWVIFCPLTFLTTWKIKILKKWKKTNTHTHTLQKILPFYICIPEIMITWFMVPEIWSAR